MDAVIENVRNSFEVGVRKVLSGQISNKKNTVTLQNYKNKSESKIFGISLSDLCGREGSEVPNIIRDICTFIQTNYLHIEGIFRISAPSAQTTKLKEAFEQNCDLQVPEVCLLSNIDGHTAANVLKQFLRQLPHPLVPEQVLKISRDSRCVSDETFAESVKSSMTTWEPVNRCTLQYLLMFLQQVMQNSENRMTVTGLGVVFGPNVFKISSGISEQETANKTFERLLMTCDIICGKNIDDQGYLKMASPTSIKPVRPAPPVPPQGRPLPPPPVPPHGPHPIPNAGLDHFDNGLPNNNEILHHEDLNDGSYLQGNDSPPLVLPRVHSLNRSYGSCDGDSDFMSTSEDYTIDDLHDQPAEEDTAKLVDRTVRHVVRKHLFNHESSSSSCADDAYSAFPNNDNSDPELLPSLTAGRIAGPANRRKPTRKHHAENGHPNSEESKLHENIEHVDPIPVQRKKIEVTNETVIISNDPIVPTSSTAVVTTPDSGCLTAEEDYPRRTHINTEVFIPKLNLQEALEEANSETTDVPRLDLSEVTQLDELTKPKPIPRQHKSNAKKKKKKGNKSSPNANTNHYKMSSEPIKIPEPNKHILDDELSSDFSPKDTSSSRWQNAWSTDDETGSPVAVLDNDIHSRYAQQVSDNMELAPSSPSENHVYPRTHHMHHNHGHHHSHSHHHHHNNPNQKQSHTQSYLSRPKLNKNLQADENIETMQNNLAEILLKLEESRKECGRPEDLTLMTRDQIRNEKIAMQKELLRFENAHGRPSTKREKEIMRDIYNRYRMVKRLQVDVMSPPFHVSVGRRFEDYDDYNEDKHMCNTDMLNDEFAVTQLVTAQPLFNEQSAESDHIPADLTIEELRRQQKEARGQRKRLRRKLRDFENEILRQFDRQVMHADRVVMATEYGDYRDLKAKLRLLDALIEKHNSQLRT